MPIPQHMDRPKEQRSIVLLLLHLILSMTLASSDTDATATRSNPNFVFVLTDDLDKTLGGPETLAKTRQLLTLATNGVDLSNWFVHTPVCCPSRAEILTGRMLHNLKVPTATGGQGCMHIDVAGDLDHRFFSEYYFARHFAERNYTVGVFGKHLNTKNPSHPPPGVDRWLVNGGGDFFDPEFDWASAGVEPTRIRFNNCTDAHGEHLPCYSTSIIGNSSIAWIRDHLNSTSSFKPFFAYVSVKAPHIQDGPGFPVAIPAPWYADASVGTRAPRTPNYNASCPDHHWLVRQQQPLSDVEAFHVDRLYESRLRSLLSVDDLVEDLVSMLEEEGVLDNTYIVFTSDNGYRLGQFRMPQGKFHPYENDVRVPFMIRGPGIFSESSVRDDIVATHVDVMPTLLGLIDGGVHDSVSIPSTMDGRNLAKDLLNAGRRGHDGVANIESSSVSPPSTKTNGHNSIVLIEYIGLGDVIRYQHLEDSYNNTFRALRILDQRQPPPPLPPQQPVPRQRQRRRNLKYIEFTNCQTDWNFTKEPAELELFDLDDDPYELTNIIHTVPDDLLVQLQRITRNLFRCRGETCRNALLEASLDWDTTTTTTAEQ